MRSLYGRRTYPEGVLMTTESLDLERNLATETLTHAVDRLREAEVALPTFAQLADPTTIPTRVRVALREEAPDVLLLPGPGNSLGGICGQLVVAEGYRGIRSREAFEAVQRSEAPVVLSMHR